MKRVLALILALVLAMGLGVVASFADDDTEIEISVIDTPYKYKGGEMQYASSFVPGDTIYFPIERRDGDEYSNVYSKKEVPNINVRSSISKGRDIFSSVDIVPKSASGLGGDFDEDAKTLYICVETKNTGSKKQIDVDYTFNITANTKKVYIYNNEATLEETFQYDSDYVDDDDYGVDDGSNVLNFDDMSGKVRLSFKNGVEFHVYVTDQKERYMEYSDDYTDLSSAESINRANPNADLDFHLFLGKSSEKTFNTTGSLYIPADRSDYIYQIVSGELTTISATYDSDESSYLIKTKTPGYYVVSDRKLSATGSASSSSESASSSSAPSGSTAKNNSSSYVGSESNPDTGANDVLGVAMALALISVASIGAISIKRYLK